LSGHEALVFAIRAILSRRTTQVPKKKVTQEELAAKIGKLKENAKVAKEKAAGKKSDPAARKAKKKVKRAQRKLRTAKAYKTGGKKAKKAEASAKA
jgi:hypothetical protein